MHPPKRFLEYDTNKWHEKPAVYLNTLQIFITERCNKQCRDCFYINTHRNPDLTLEQYKNIVSQYRWQTDKITLMGGEPTLHKDVCRMIEYNQNEGLFTTLFTNGSNLKIFDGFDLTNVSLNISIFGLDGTEKNLMGVRTNHPITVSFMVRPDNKDNLLETSRYAENNFDCSTFAVTSMKDPQEFGKKTESTVSDEEYINTVQKFVHEYDGDIGSLFLRCRGLFWAKGSFSTCRFYSVLTNNDRVICPLDISCGVRDTDNYRIGTRRCRRAEECLLQNVVLNKKRTV